MPVYAGFYPSAHPCWVAPESLGPEGALQLSDGVMGTCAVRTPLYRWGFCSSDAERHPDAQRKLDQPHRHDPRFRADIPVSMPDAALRGQVFNYFEQVLVRHKHREPSQKEHDYAAARTLMRFPQLIDHHIRLKEESGDGARAVSSEKVIQTERIFDDSAAASGAACRGDGVYTRSRATPTRRRISNSRT